MCLRAFPAPQPPRTDRNLGLLNLVPRPLGIVLRIHETGEPLFLVRLQDVHPRDEEHRSHAHRCQQHDHQPLLPLHSAQKYPHDGDGHIGQGCAQIGLRQYHQHRNANNGCSLNKVRPREFPMPQIGKILRHRQDKDQLYPFRGLEVIAAGHFDPPPRPQVLLSKDEYRHQRGDRRDVKPVDPIEQYLVVHGTDYKHGPHSTQNPVNLLEVRPGKLCVHRGAADFHHSQPADHEHKAQQQPVKISK